MKKQWQRLLTATRKVWRLRFGRNSLPLVAATMYILFFEIYKKHARCVVHDIPQLEVTPYFTHGNMLQSSGGWSLGTIISSKYFVSPSLPQLPIFFMSTN